MRQTDVHARFIYDGELDHLEFSQLLSQFFYDNGMTLVSAQSSTAIFDAKNDDFYGSVSVGLTP